MKKILMCTLTVFMLFGCAQKNNDEHKNKAIEAFVASANKLSDEKNISIEMDGKVDIPASALSKEEIAANIVVLGQIDLEKNKFSFDIETKDQEATNKMKVLSDMKYLYINSEGKWIKQKIDSQYNKQIEESKKADEKMTVESATAFFSKLKDVSYTKATNDGVDGYFIEGKIIVSEIMKELNETKSDDQLKDQYEEFKKIFDKLDINYKVFVPEDVNKLMINYLEVKLEFLKMKMNAGPFEIKTKPTDKKIKVPEEAMSASELPSDNQSGFNMIN